MLEVDNSVEIACGRRSINELKSSTSLLTLVGFGVEKMIAEIALVVDKETSYREASLVAIVLPHSKPGSKIGLRLYMRTNPPSVFRP